MSDKQIKEATDNFSKVIKKQNVTKKINRYVNTLTNFTEEHKLLLILLILNNVNIIYN